MNQQQIDKLAEAFRQQGLTWNQTNFAVSVVRNQVAAEREQCANIVERYQVPVGNSAAGELAAEWTVAALREVRDAIRKGSS